jgi:Holliday junction DNA helicase RuvB
MPEVFEFLNEHPEYADVLRRAVEEEERHSSEPHWLGWTWDSVRAFTSTINSLIIKGLVRVNYQSAKFTNYLLVDREAVKEALSVLEQVERHPKVEDEAEVPGDLFEVIIGYEDVKQLLWDSINADRPCHVLLCGPPASAKSMFLMELDRLPNSHFALGGQTSKVGLADELFESNPKYLIIDELDDMPVQEQSVLKSLMWGGVVARRKHGIKERGKFETWVYGSVNNINRLTDAVRSRFMKVFFQPYSVDQFKEVVVSVLTRREGLDHDLAEHIAEVVGRHTRDPREAINMARISRSREKVEKYAELLWGRLEVK